MDEIVLRENSQYKLVRRSYDNDVVYFVVHKVRTRSLEFKTLKQATKVYKTMSELGGISHGRFFKGEKEKCGEIPFPKCYEGCEVVKILGAGECENVCPLKFKKETSKNG